MHMHLYIVPEQWHTVLHTVYSVETTALNKDNLISWHDTIDYKRKQFQNFISIIYIFCWDPSPILIRVFEFNQQLSIECILRGCVPGDSV